MSYHDYTSIATMGYQAKIGKPSGTTAFTIPKQDVPIIKAELEASKTARPVFIKYAKIYNLTPETVRAAYRRV